MNSFANRKKALTVLLVLIAAVCLAAALTISLPAERAFAQGDNDESSAKRTPVVTYVIGDSTVTDESGFTYDEDTNTYTYVDHAKGWSAALAKSVELYNADEENANLVKVKLASDWVLSGAISFGAKYNIILDLNGYEINRNGSATNTGTAFSVSSGIFEMTDNSENGDGKLTGAYNTSTVGAVTVSSGKFILSGGSICDNYGKNGGGISATGGTIIINGGKISNNEVTGLGGGIYSNGATIIIDGGEISHNTAKNTGGGIYTTSAVTMNGGNISYNYSASAGGGICTTNLFTMSGGEISYNYANSSGGGIYTSYVNSYVFVFTGGSIINNNAKTAGGAYYIYSGDAAVKMSGELVVKDNTSGATLNDDRIFTDGNVSNIIIRQNQKFIIDGVLYDENENNANINISFTLATELTSGYAANNTDENGIVTDPAKYFISDNDSYKVILNTAGEVQFTNQGALEWSVTGETQTYVENSAYGSVFTYSENEIKGISLKQGDTDIENITVTDANGQTIADLAANPLTNAGTYYATATVKGVGTADVQVKFTIVILPYNIEGKVDYTVTASGWTDEDGQYTATYDGTGKTAPSLAATLNGSAFADSNYSLSYLLNGATVTELKEVGTYTVVITGTGNYTGTVTVNEKFNITPDDTKEYTVTWQYYANGEWKDLSEANGAAFTYTSADYSGLVRIVLSVENLETRYVYANGVTEYNLAESESTENVTKVLTVGIAKDTETAIINAGEYALTLNGTPNYTVAEADTTSAVTVAKYNLANILSDSTDTATVNASLSTTVFDGEAKTLSLSASVTLGGNSVVLGTSGAEYDYVVKYINADGSETEVEQFILGGTYKIYIVVAGSNFTGTLGVVGTVTIEQAANAFTSFGGVGNWLYGTYDARLHSVSGSVRYLYDGTVAGTQQAYVYYTVYYRTAENELGEAVNATLTRFTSLTDEVANALNALNAGSYTLIAEVDETSSYAGATRSGNFAVVKATNSWLKEPSVIGWAWDGYDDSFDHLIAAAKYGNESMIKTVKDGEGNTIEGLANITELTDEILAKLKTLGAGSYTLSIIVADTDNYSGLIAEVEFAVSKANNAWDTPLDIYSWTWGNYEKEVHGIIGTAVSGGEVLCTILDRNTGKAVEGYVNIAPGADLSALPAGEYVLVGSVAESGNYNAFETRINFNVEKTNNEWTTAPEVKSFVAGYYDETANAVKGSAKYGEITYAIKDADGNEVTDLANAEVGKYTLTMTVAGTDNYEGLTYTSTFNVFESTDLKGGEIAGIVVMSVIVAGLAAAVVVLLIKRRKTV